MLDGILRSVLDAIDADCQPVSKDELTYVKPSWLFRVRETAVSARAALNKSPDNLRILLAARQDLAEWCIWYEMLKRLPSTPKVKESIEFAERQKDASFDFMLGLEKKNG